MWESSELWQKTAIETITWLKKFLYQIHFHTCWVCLCRSSFPSKEVSQTRQNCSMNSGLNICQVNVKSFQRKLPESSENTWLNVCFELTMLIVPITRLSSCYVYLSSSNSRRNSFVSLEEKGNPNLYEFRSETCVELMSCSNELTGSMFMRCCKK